MSWLASAVTLAAALTACAGVDNEAVSTGQPAAPVTTAKPAPPNPAEIAANELGFVPVLMYHQIAPNPAGEYDQTPAEFRDELERLYRENYRPVTAAHYIAGDLDLPASTPTRWC